MIITGIGSRQTPEDVLIQMEKIGKWIKANDHICRSGHADGADWAFEKGAQENCIVYLPWGNFNSNLRSNASKVVVEITNRHRELVNKYHPAPSRLSQGAYRLMARNCNQILGNDLESPSDAVVCWTPNGELVGGTAFAMRIALDMNIKVINLFDQYVEITDKNMMAYYYD